MAASEQIIKVSLSLNLDRHLFSFGTVALIDASCVLDLVELSSTDYCTNHVKGSCVGCWGGWGNDLWLVRRVCRACWRTPC